MTTFANFIKQPTHPRPAVSDPLILGSPSGWFGPETMIGASAVQILRRSIAAALLGLSLLLGLAAPDEAHAQTSCNVSDATTQATNAYNYHRNNAAGNAPTATAAYRVLVALGGTLPAWSGTNISSISAPTTPISEAELRTFLTGRSDTWAGWNPVYTALSCLEAALPTVTISGGPAVTEGAGAQFTVNISPAQGSSVTVNLTVSDVAGSDYVASSNQGSQTVSIPANQTSATHTVPTVNDQSDEANGDVTVTVIGGGVGDGYRIGATATATVRVNDNDEPAGERHLLISNIGQAGNNNSSGSLNVDRAQAFTTGSHKPGYTVNSVDIVFESNSLSDLFRTPNPSLTVTIRNASNGIPGTTVGTLNLPASSPTFGSRRSITFAAPTKGIQLSPSTTYFLMIDIDAERSTTGETDIWLVDSNTEDAGGAAGFSIANESQMYAWSANAWESTNNSFQMRIKGESNPITDLVQMRNATRNIAEFGNHKGNGGIRVLVEIGDGMSRQSYARTINYTVDGKADRGDGKDYTIDGCTSSNCSVRLPANRHSVPITIYVNDDGLDENEETITLTLQDGIGYTVNENRKTTTVTIRDDDTRGLTFRRRWADVDEGGNETYTLRLSSQPTAAVTVNIASDNPDVTVSPTSLTFNPSGSDLWSATQTVTVSAAQDNDAVDDEATLTHTTSGGDYGGAGAMSIERPVSVDDDDTADPIKPQLPLINLTGGPAVTEGAAASFTVHADPSPTARLTVSVEVIEPPGQDFVAASQERVLFVSLNAGATTATFSVPTVNDSTDEDDGAVQVFVNDGAGYVAGQGTAVTVFDNDEPIPGAFFRSTSSDAVEHGGTHRVQVYLNYPAPAAGLTLRYRLTGTATAGSGNDFTIQNFGTVSVAARDASATIPVAINDDSAIEDAETVILTLIGGTGYTVDNPSVHTLTIADNDSPMASFASSSSRVAENAGTHNVTVNISPAPVGGLTLGYSVTGTATAGSGNDFTIQNSGSLTIAAGATSATIPVAINDDSADEVAETVILTLTDGTGYMLGSTTTHTLTITDNDGITSVLLTPLIPSNTIPEGASVAITGVFSENDRHLSPKDIVTLPLTIGGTATLGTDYRLTCGPVKIPVVVTYNGLNGNNPSITFDASRLRNPFVRVPGSLHLEALEDNTSESNETVTLSIGGGPTRTMTITEAPSSVAVSFTRATYSINEGASPLPPVITVTPASGRDLTIPLIFTDVSATGGVDYTAVSQVVLEADGNTRYSFDVPIADDTAIEGDETFRMAIDTANLPAGVTAGTATEATVTIVDNDNSATFASGSSRAAEDAGTHNVTVNLSFAAPAGGLTLNYSVGGTATAGSGNDFTIEGSGSLTVAAGATSATIPVAINDDSADEVAETVILTLSDGTGYTLGSTTTHTLTITDNDGITTVLLTPLIPSNTIPEGASVAITGVFSENNRHLSPKDIVTLPLTIGGTATLGTDYRLTCGPVKIPVVVTCNGLNGNNPSITFDASRLRNPFVRVPGSLHLEALEDNTSESNETVTLSIGGGPTRTMTITEAPSSVAVSFTRATYSINEGASPLPPVITVTPASGRDLTIPLIFTNISATGGADYTAVSQVVLEADGNTRYSFDVSIADDTAIEGDETFRMAIDTANLPAGVTAGTATEATVTIVDNDPVPVAHWKFDGDADDSAGSSNGSAMNGASFTTTATIGSHALVLDGSDDHVNLTPHVTKFPLGNAARSISGWFKADAGNQRQTFLTYGPNIEGKRLSIAADRTQALVAVSGHAWGVNNLSLAEGWHHIAVTFAGGQSDDFSIYLDGALQSASTLGGVARQVDTRTGTAAIGRNVGGTAHYGGEIDDVRLYDFALSLKQVQAMAAWREDVQPAAAALPMRAPMGLVVRGWSASDMSWGMSGTTAVDVEAPEAGVRRQVPLLPSASNPQHAGLVRIVNPTARAGRVRILAVDDTGRRSDPVVLGMGARETLEFTSRDLEWGGAAFDPEESTGPGMGHWRLEIESDLEVEVSGYVRAADGTLSEMGGVAAPSADNVHRLALFHPADSSDAASLLRLTNRGGQALVANITGIDDTGASPGGVVSVEVGAHGSVMLTASELESGGADLLGALGDGGGAWRLDVVSDGDLAVMNLVETPDGHLANLSNAEATPVPAGVVHGVAGFPSGAVESGEVGVLRIVNGSGVSGSIRIRLHDGVGWRYAPLTLSLGAGEAVNLSALDLELGNTSKGLIGSAGPGSGGEWRLGVSGDIDIEVMALVRLPSGLLEALP